MDISHWAVKQALENAQNAVTYFKIGPNLLRRTGNSFRMAAIIFKGKKLISEGVNNTRSYSKLKPEHVPFMRFPDSIHAEFDAIVGTDSSLDRSTLVVIRTNRFNQLLLAKPCKKCEQLIGLTGIRNVWYSISSYPYLEKL